MKFLILFSLFANFALAAENPTQDQIRLKLWYEGVSLEKNKNSPQSAPKLHIEEIERPLRKLFSEE
jgi:hypothetical protein